MSNNQTKIGGKKRRLSFVMRTIVVVIITTGLTVAAVIFSTKEWDVYYNSMPHRQTYKTFSLSQYNQLKKGMSFAQANAIMGEEAFGIHGRKNIATATIEYAWFNSYGADFRATFQDDHLIGKAEDKNTNIEKQMLSTQKTANRSVTK